MRLTSCTGMSLTLLYYSKPYTKHMYISCKSIKCSSVHVTFTVQIYRFWDLNLPYAIFPQPVENYCPCTTSHVLMHCLHANSLNCGDMHQARYPKTPHLMHFDDLSLRSFHTAYSAMHLHAKVLHHWLVT